MLVIGILFGENELHRQPVSTVIERANGREGNWKFEFRQRTDLLDLVAEELLGLAGVEREVVGDNAAESGVGEDGRPIRRRKGRCGFENVKRIGMGVHFENQIVAALIDGNCRSSHGG